MVVPTRTSEGHWASLVLEFSVAKPIWAGQVQKSGPLHYSIPQSMLRKEAMN